VSIIQVKNVPVEMHSELRRRADQEGMTIRDYVLKLIERDQRVPSRRDWLERVSELEPVAVSRSAVEMVREGREERDRELTGRSGGGGASRSR
jgi:antitoxin FitA